MKYLMLVCVDPDLDQSQVRNAPDIEDWVAEMDGKGIRLLGDRVRPGPTPRPCGCATARCCSPTGRTSRPRT